MSMTGEVASASLHYIVRDHDASLFEARKNTLRHIEKIMNEKWGKRPYRRIRLDAMADAELLRRNKARLKFSRKVSAALVEEAADSLAQAKAMHDELEGLYNPHVDFDRVYQTAQAITDELTARL